MATFSVILSDYIQSKVFQKLFSDFPKFVNRIYLFHLNRFFGVLVLGGIGFLGGGTLGEHGSSVLVQLELGDDTVGWVDTNLDGATVHFLALHSFDVDDEFSSVNIDDLTGLLAFEVTTDNHDLD